MRCCRGRGLTPVCVFFPVRLQCGRGADGCLHHPEYRPGADALRRSSGHLPDCQNAAHAETGHGADWGKDPTQRWLSSSSSSLSFRWSECRYLSFFGIRAGRRYPESDLCMQLDMLRFPWRCFGFSPVVFSSSKFSECRAWKYGAGWPTRSLAQ